MPRKETLVQLSDELIGALDRVSARDGVSRSEAIRRAIARTYREDVSAEVDRLIVEGYKRIPAGAIDEWGDIDAQMAAMSEETMRRLDLEDGGWPTTSS